MELNKISRKLLLLIRSLDWREMCMFCEDDEEMEPVAQGSCACPIPGNVQGHVVWGSEQPRLVKVLPGHGEGFRTR